TYKAMRAAKDAGHDDTAAGLHKLLHPDHHPDPDDDEEDVKEEESEPEKEKEEEEEDGMGEEHAEMEGMGEEGPGEPDAHNQGPDGKGGPATAWESRRRRRLRGGEVRLTESRSLELCRAAGVEATADVIEAMRNADFDQAMRIVKLARRGQQAPR